MKERLQKILSRAGLGSRRACEGIISQGRITINGFVAALGDKVDGEKDEIRLDGKKIDISKPEYIYIAFNKPAGVLSEIYPKLNNKTVRDFVSITDYLFIVGRLDKESEGLILLTNDGDLANRYTHPRYEHEKEYQVLVSRKPDRKQMEIWRNGVVLINGERTLPAKVSIYKKSYTGYWLKVILKEGKKRQIREVGGAISLPVKRIIRTRIGKLHLGTLKPGHWRKVSINEVV